MKNNEKASAAVVAISKAEQQIQKSNLNSTINVESFFILDYLTQTYKLRVNDFLFIR